MDMQNETSQAGGIALGKTSPVYECAIMNDKS